MMFRSPAPLRACESGVAALLCHRTPYRVPIRIQLAIVGSVRLTPEKIQIGVTTYRNDEPFDLTLALRDQNWNILSKESDIFK